VEKSERQSNDGVATHDEGLTEWLGL
jgi:hypothetical protein